MSLQKTSSEKNCAILEILIDKADFDAQIMKVYKKNVGKINVPGFRKGKAPKNIIEKMYGASVFYDEAIDDLLPNEYSAAVSEAKLDVVSRPEIEVVSIDEKGVLVTAKVYLKPDATVNKYKGLTAEKETVVVEQDEIDREIEAIRKRNSRVLTVDNRKAIDGDEAIIDFEGFLDGVAFDGGKAEKHSLKLGSGSFIPGFEEQIIGHEIGDEFDINVKFPEDYNADNLSGKDVVFNIKLHELKTVELPELDDEFVKDVSEFNTLDEYIADITAKINERKTKACEHAFEEKLIDDLLANTEIDVPAPMIENEIDSNVNDYEYRMKSQGGSLDMYFKYTGMNMEQLRDSFRDRSEREVKTRLALETIVKLENIEATEDEINEEYLKIASGYTMELEKVKEAIPADGISRDVVIRKAVEFIKSNAIVTEMKPEKSTDIKEPDKKPAKTKAAAKKTPKKV